MRQVTTPFGRRPMTLALVQRQLAADNIKADKFVDKWAVFRDAAEARQVLGLQDRSLAILDALLSFYPDRELREGSQLVVFPSNAQLALRAHGIAEATLRRHLALLVDAGLIVRRDSANGKRYARKDEGGVIESAFGFDLSPLLARSEELALLAQQVVSDRNRYRRMKEDLTICRRDARKLISAALEDDTEGKWLAVEDMYLAIVARIPRAPSLEQLAALVEEMEMLLEEVVNMMENRQKSSKSSGNADQNERHIQNSNTNTLHESELCSGKEQKAEPVKIRSVEAGTTKAFPLAVVLQACPTIHDYGPGGGVGSWRDLMSAAVVIRSMLGVSPSAYEEACAILGPENAAIAVACMLERTHLINSPGGYLRDLTRRASRGEFSLGPMVMALLNARATTRRSAG
ncbi:plasmid replication protein RepC [Rhizobium halophytocola]|uniref:Replication initiation protein RepC n=1 Tax=Rhizobium halophytocola TaxID=735519 RepID=A0ABS4E4H4_9HYPH|nr:plasmid replication protein RepC [Rhizobium halophytocola]MBP1852823.1 replication initiation protein RepC [Rhizobium halophytocola]